MFNHINDFVQTENRTANVNFDNLSSKHDDYFASINQAQAHCQLDTTGT